MTESSNTGHSRLAIMSTQRAELLKLMLERQSRQQQKIAPYPRSITAGEITAPASWGQRRLWLLDRSEGGSAGFQVPLTVRLQGDLDESALRVALTALVQRHEVLRTSFFAVDDEPFQRVEPDAGMVLSFIDLTNRSRAERAGEVRRHQHDEVNVLFDLSSAPLIRGRLLRTDALEHVLLLNLHHIVVDGWSKGILIREIVQLYNACREGRANPLGPLAIQYADYARWQHGQWIDSAELRKKLDYWRNRLQGVHGQFALPTDHEWPARRSHRGESVPVVLQPEFSAELRRLALKYDVTLFMLLLAAWSILLARLSGEEDVVVGTPIANRQHAETEGLIGLFVNPLTLRIEVRRDMHLADLLHMTKNVTLGAYDHQEVPFEKVVEALNPNARVSRTPLFRVVFVLHTEPAGDWRLSGLSATVEEEVDEPAMIDLLLSLEADGSGFSGRIYYAAELFERQTMRQWVMRFDTLLHAMVSTVNCRVSDLPVL